MSLLTGIDTVLDEIVDRNPDATGFYSELSLTAPFVAAYLLDRDTEMLSEPEQDYLLFLGMVIITFLRDHRLLTADIDPELLGTTEGSIWNAEGFADPKEIHPQLEEVNAFIEEALVQDQDTDFLSKAGVQIIYAKLYALALAALRQEKS